MRFDPGKQRWDITIFYNGVINYRADVEHVDMVPLPDRRHFLAVNGHEGSRLGDTVRARPVQSASGTRVNYPEGCYGGFAPISLSAPCLKIL